MQVTIDKFSGFCWGVVRTVQIAEQALLTKEKVYVLGISFIIQKKLND